MATNDTPTPELREKPTRATELTEQPIQVLIGCIERHRVFSHRVGQHRLVVLVRVHNHDLAVRLESLLVRGTSITEDVHAAVPHDMAVGSTDSVDVPRYLAET